jgi:hypothetical protein
MVDEAREEIRELVDELFIATDAKDWNRAEALFVTGPIEVDMTSLIGGTPFHTTARELIGGFRIGLHAGKLSHHMATNYRISLVNDVGEVQAHGYAWNMVPAMPEGSNVWETWGVYRLGVVWTSAGWRLNAFRYFSRRTAGNDAVRTHTA